MRLKSLALAAILGLLSVGLYAGEPVDVSPWMPVIGDLVQLAIQIATPIFVMFASWAAWKLAKKLGMEKNAAMDEMLRSYVKEAINWADAWAKKQSGKEPSGEDKKAEAIRYLLDLLSKSALPKIAEERLSALIEAQLAYDKKLLPNADLKGTKVLSE